MPHDDATLKFLTLSEMSLRGYMALAVVEKIVRDVFPGVLRTKKLTDTRLVVEINEDGSGRNRSHRHR